YFALALAQLAATAGDGVAWIGRRLRPEGLPAAAAWTTLALGLVPAVVMAPDGVRSLWVWRRTGGRYDDRGTLIRSHIDLLVVLKDIVKPATLPGTVLNVGASANWGWEHQWAYAGNAVGTGLPVSST